MLMSKRPTVSVSIETEEARQQFEDWRRDRKRGERIPVELWGTAVALAKKQGVWPTAKALHLDHSGLKRRVRNEEEDGRSGAFVEVIPQGAMLYSCTVEM